MTSWNEQTKNSTSFTNCELDSQTLWSDPQTTWADSGAFWAGGISWIDTGKSLQLLMIDDTYLFEIDSLGHNLIIDDASAWTNRIKN
jgi:hypothetical protein